jgi:hypothetical protein
MGSNGKNVECDARLTPEIIRFLPTNDASVAANSYIYYGVSRLFSFMTTTEILFFPSIATAKFILLSEKTILLRSDGLFRNRLDLIYGK